VANEAGANARQAQSQIAELGRDLDRLSMITQALWLILKDEHGYDDDVLRAKVMAIDLSERAQAGGEGKPPPLPCPKCNRPLGRRHARCIYCGAERPLDLFER
jgi:hypothetical protein